MGSTAAGEGSMREKEREEGESEDTKEQ